MSLDLGELVIRLSLDNTRFVSGIAESKASMKSLASDAQASGDATGQNLAAGVQDGLDKIPAAARQAGNEVASNLKAGLGAAEKVAEDAGGDAGKKFGKELADKAKAAAVVGGAAVGTALSAGVVDNMNIDVGRRKLAAQLNLSATEAKAAGKLAGSIYADNFGESLDDVNQAVRLVMQNTGLALNSVDLQPVTEKVLALRDTFDQDLGMTTAAVGQMIRTGMVKDAQEGLDVLTVGLQGPANKADDLMETMNEYGTQFRKVGLNGAMSVGLINQAMKAGARDSDIAADAIKEFSIRAIDGSALTAQGFKGLGLNAKQMAADIARGGPTAAKALDQTLDRLRAVKDPAERSRLAVALFGTQAEDLGNALYAMDPSKAVAGLGQVAGAADKVNSTTGGGAAATVETYRRKILELGRSAIESTGPTAAVAGAVSAFAPAALAVLGPMGQLLVARRLQKVAANEAAVAESRSALVTVRGWVVAGAAATWNGIKVAAAWTLSAGSAMAAAVAGTVRAGAAMAAQWVMMAARAGVNALRVGAAWLLSTGVGMVTALASMAVAVASVVAGWVLMGVQAMAQAVRMAAAWFIALGPIGWAIAAIVGVALIIWKNWDKIKQWTIQIWDWVVGKVKKVPGLIVGFFLNWTLAGLIIKHWDKIRSGIVSVSTAIVNFVKGLPGRIIGALAALGGMLWNAAVGAFNRYYSAITTTAGKAITWVRGLPGKIVAALGNVGSALYSKGVAIVQGLINGIKSMAGKISDTLVGLLPGPLKKFAGKLGIASPSKLFAWFGRMIGLGLVGGMDGTGPAVDASIAKLAGRVTQINIKAPALDPYNTYGKRPPPDAPGGSGAAAGAGPSKSITQNIYETSDARVTAAESARLLALEGV